MVSVFIHNSKHRALSVHPQSAPLSSHNKLEGRIPLTLTFHPHNISVKNIILKNFKLLQHDPTTAEIFAQPLLISRAFPPISSIVLPVPYCKKVYIGETGRRLGDRFREQLRDVEINDKDASKPVARHFNLRNHSQKHMAVCDLSLHLGNTESRKNIEQKVIFQIGKICSVPVPVNRSLIWGTRQNLSRDFRDTRAHSRNEIKKIQVNDFMVV